MNSPLNQISSNLPQPKAWILDVGHGNSTVVEIPGAISVIDGGGDDTLVRFLSDRGISQIENIIVSHADADHFAGVSLLLSDDDFKVAKVYLNQDPRETRLWNDFVSVMLDAKARGTKFNLELNNVNPGKLEHGNIMLEVLAPSQELLYTTVTGRDSAGNRLSANTMSAVVRVWAGDSPRILLPGDIDNQGLEYLFNDGFDMRADVLVFPHHGGSARVSDQRGFARRVLEAVQAGLVVFSIGRAGPYNNPRPEHISTALESVSSPHIACTQLSKRCADEVPPADSSLHRAIGRGVETSSCCAGTIQVSLDEFAYQPDYWAHQNFIAKYAPTALCRI